MLSKDTCASLRCNQGHTLGLEPHPKLNGSNEKTALTYFGPLRGHLLCAELGLGSRDGFRPTRQPLAGVATIFERRRQLSIGSRSVLADPAQRLPARSKGHLAISHSIGKRAPLVANTCHHRRHRWANRR